MLAALTGLSKLIDLSLIIFPLARNLMHLSGLKAAVNISGQLIEIALLLIGRYPIERPV